MKQINNIMTKIEDHNRQKKAAVINDFCSFGRCSLAVTIPILAAMKIQCCSVPTSLFTNHTGYDSFAWTDYTSHMDDYIVEWKKLDLHFSAIATGFLGSSLQIDFVNRFIKAFHDKETLVVVDPVMGDYGELYPTYSRELAESMRDLMDVADILTPNLTEACVLAEQQYDSNVSDKSLTDLCMKLTSRHASKVVISGIPRGNDLINVVYERGNEIKYIPEKKIGEDRSGTGDVFSSVILGDAINGVPFEKSVQHASAFVAKAVARTVEMGLPEKDGLAIEEILKEI